jgi:thymidylate kinase
MTHPVLTGLFDALDRERIDWVLLRPPSNPAAPAGDVDLLVAPAAAPALRRVAEERGFVALPGYTAAPNLILLRYDRRSDHWLILDVATSIAFDDDRVALAGLADDVLARRRRDGPAWVPDDEDAFWLLVLRCLLDKRAVPTHYERRLRSGADGARGPLAVALARGMDVEPLRAAAAAGDWDALLARGREVRSVLQPRPSLRARGGRAARWARRPLLIPRRRGVSIALLGSNGAGKSTLAAELRARLPLPSALVYMGLWKLDEPGGAQRVGAALRRPLRMWRRYAAALRLQLQGRVVVFDRYVYDAFLPPSPPLLAAKRVYLRALTHALPAPDLAVVLDVPPEVAYARKQENSLEELDGEREVYRRLAASLPNAATVDAAQTPDEVRADVTQLVWDQLSRRWRGIPAR